MTSALVVPASVNVADMTSALVVPASVNVADMPSFSDSLYQVA